MKLIQVICLTISITQLDVWKDAPKISVEIWLKFGNYRLTFTTFMIQKKEVTQWSGRKEGLYYFFLLFATYSNVI